MRDAPQPQVLREAVLRLVPPELLASARQLGEATRAQGELPVPLRRTLHDIRGGALAVLFTHVRLIADGEAEPGDVQTAVWMAGDQAKMMRNAIFDLDPHVRAADEGDKIHPVDDFVRKWSGSSSDLAGRRVRVRVNARFAGAIANRCLETSAARPSALQPPQQRSALRRRRNGAAGHPARGPGPGTLGRAQSVVGISDGVAGRGHPPRSPSALSWRPDPRGEGIGLNTCADIVAACFGLPSGEEAVDDGYLGARVIEDVYAAWFHWPAA